MAVLKKVAGFIAGVSTVAGLGVAVAQGVPPNPFISNPALGAGQQSTHLTPMGETGVSGVIDVIQGAQITPVPQAATVAPAEPSTAQAQPAEPEPAQPPVAQAEPTPAPAQEPQTMGAAPSPQEQAPVVARADRN